MGEKEKCDLPIDLKETGGFMVNCPTVCVCVNAVLPFYYWPKKSVKMINLRNLRVMNNNYFVDNGAGFFRLKVELPKEFC